MNLLFKQKLANVSKRLGLGILDVALPNISENIKSDLGGKGKLDIIRIAPWVIILICILLYAFGLITMDDITKIASLFF